jgi:hypothetical protein
MTVQKPTDVRITAALTALGAVVLAAAGFFTITTPGEQRCREELADSKLECAQKTASDDADAVRKISSLESQVSVLTYKTQALKEARDACQVALDDLSAKKARQPESVAAAYRALGAADDALNEGGVTPANP